MRIQVSGKQLDTGEALQTHVEDRLLETLDKYSQRPTEAVVTFSKDAHELVCDSSVHLSSGLTVQAKGRANEIYESFEEALERMDKQMRRHRRRLKDHNKTRKSPVEVEGASSYVLAAYPDDSDLEGAVNGDDTLQPMIVAEMETKVKTLSVGEAVMEMELSAAPMLVFRNSSHGGVNVIYTRDDGNIGWIDPRKLG
ncbi:ribosome hibernation-promoting factor, HPF/YfiA family [Paracoccaceae bacterium GXU_MW_L88]